MASSSMRPRWLGPLEHWERLVDAVLIRDRERQRAAKEGLGLAASVPASLAGRSSELERILQAADHVQYEDPNVVRIRTWFRPKLYHHSPI